MKLKRSRGTAGFHVPISATSDIAFLLLIFIMLVALISYRQEVAIDHAEARTVLKTGADLNLEIWIDRQGAVYLDGFPANLDDVADTVAALYVSAPETRVHVIADRNTRYANVNAVLEILQILQYRTVSFVVKNVE